MKNYVIIFSLLLAFCLFVVSCSDESSTQSDNSISHIKGQVVDISTYEPIANAFISTEPPSTTVLTDMNGEFLIDIYKSGNYSITVMKKGYYSNIVSVSVESGKTTNAVIPLYDSAYANHPPDKPNLIKPMDNSTANTSVELIWDCTDEDNDPLTYDVYLDKNSMPTTTIFSSITQTKMTVEKLIPNTTYYWKVVARDKYGAISESDIFSFDVDTSVVSIPDIVFFYNFNNNSDMTTNFNLAYTDNISQYTFDRGNKTNQAAYFDGTNRIIIDKANELELTTEFTIAVWLKPDAVYGVNHNGWVMLIGRWKNTGAKASTYSLTININVNKYVGFTHDGKTNSLCEANSVLQTGVWTHVAFTYRNKVGKIYINGTLSGTATVVEPQSSDYKLLIGMQDDGKNAFKGAIDDLFLYSRALSDSEIANLAK